MAEIKINLGIGNKAQLKREIQGVLKDSTNVNLKGNFNNFFKGIFSDINGSAGKSKDPKTGMEKVGQALGRAGVIALTLGQINKGIGKMINVLSESSASLKATVLLGKQAFRLFMKPFGDALGALFRPAMIWLLKMAVRWNQAFDSKENGTPLKDAMDSLFGGNNVLQKKPSDVQIETTPIKGLSNLFQSIDWEGIGKAIADFISSGVAKFQELKSAIINKVTEWTTSIATGITKAGNAVSDFFNKISEWVNKMLNKIGLGKKEDKTTTKTTSTTATSSWSDVSQYLSEKGKVITANPYAKFAANGGVYDSRTNLTVGERGPEAVIPLNKMDGMGGQQTFNITINNPVIDSSQRIEELARKIKEQFRRETRTRTSYGAF